MPRRISRLLLLMVLMLTASSPEASAGLIAAYGFNEGTGTAVADAAGNGHTGTISGATWSTQGKFGNALSFNGTTNWVTVNSSSLLNLTTAMTLEAWVFPTTATGVRDIIIKEGSNVDIYNLYARNWRGLPESNIFVGGANRVAEGATLPANVWTHVAGTYDGAALRLFINGVQVASTAITGTVTTSTGPLRIGGNSMWGEFFQGLMDEVRIYNHALSQAEIQTDMNTPVGGVLPDSAGPSVAITSHTNNQTVTTNTITVAGTASDSGLGNSGILSVTVNGVAATGGTATGSATANWSRSVTLNPGANAITVVTRDNSAAQNSTTASINVTYAPSNTAPTISAIGAQTTNEDTASGAIGFTVGDAQTAAESLTVSGSSSNTTLVPNANILFGGSGANRTVTITPAANQNGTATITVTVTVSDGQLSTPTSFQLTVNAVNDAPTITSIANQTTTSGTATAAIGFTVGDVETAAGSLTVSGFSSNTTLVPNGNITFGGSGASRTVTVAPAAGQTGNANFTVTVSDGQLTTSTSFSVTVNATPSGLIAAYGFNEGSGTSTSDATGQGHTGAITSATWSTQGKFGNALSFNGTSSWVTVADADDLDLTTAMTVEAWVFPTTSSGVRDILIKEGTNVDVYNLYARNWRGLPESNGFIGGSNRTAEGAVLPANVWTHVAGTYDGSAVRLFINGVQAASTAISGAMSASTGPLRIGGNSLWGEFFQGQIDEVRIYNRALSQAGIQTDMNAPVVSAAPSISGLNPISGPVGTSVTISGTNFGATQDTGTVTFNGVAATPSSWNATSIGAPVPASATTGPVVVTVGGVASNGVTFTVTTKLAITSVNSGSNPIAGTAFPIVAQSQSTSGTAANVSTATNVSLSLKTGTGTLGGTLTGTITAGTNQVTISGVTYSKAESGVVITATRTSGDNLTASDSAPFTVNAGAANKLVFSTQPGNNTAGSALSGPPTVVVQDSLGNTVTSSTASITVAIGTNPGSGTLSGTTTKNAASGVASFTDLGIDKAANGYTLTASAAGLTGTTTAAFNISSAAAAQVAFTTQPGNATGGSAIPGPATVTVQDSFGNIVTTSTASITVAIATNPSDGTLSGTTTVNASSGIATFTELSIIQAGNGYTLLVSSAGLSGATSNGFNITSGSGSGLIAGIITRVSNGAALSGALVEAIQGSSIVASATTNSSGNYSIEGLATGTYTVRAWFTGLVPQVLDNVAVTSGNTTTVDLSLNFGITVQSPVAGEVVIDFSVLVTGNFNTSLAPEVGIQVNGYVALQDGDEFAALVPIDSTTTTLTATLTNTAGTQLAGDVVPITPQVPTTAPALFFRPSPALALVSQPVGFTLTSVNPLTQIRLDGNGDGAIDHTGTTLQGITVTFAASGLYFPTVSVTEQSGVVRTATTIVQVFDSGELDTLLQNKWTAMKNALRSGNVGGAASHIVLRRRATYEAMFNALIIPLANIDQVLTSIAFRNQRGIEAEYEMMVNRGGTQFSYMVLFAIDEDGVWRVKFF